MKNHEIMKHHENHGTSCQHHEKSLSIIQNLEHPEKL